MDSSLTQKSTFKQLVVQMNHFRAHVLISIIIIVQTMNKLHGNTVVVQCGKVYVMIEFQFQS